MKNIFIFDMDGTLTPSRREMTKDFEVFYSNWAENHTFFLVSGSNPVSYTHLRAHET